jgi:hypothetical protein
MLCRAHRLTDRDTGVACQARKAGNPAERKSAEGNPEEVHPEEGHYARPGASCERMPAEYRQLLTTTETRQFNLHDSHIVRIVTAASAWQQYRKIHGRLPGP